MSVYTTDKNTGPLAPVWKLSIDARVERVQCLRVIDSAIAVALAANETAVVTRLMAVRERLSKD